MIKHSDTNSNTLEVLLDHNIGEPVAWISKEDYIAAGGNEKESVNNKYGPITLINTLKQFTKNWQGLESFTNVDNVTMLDENEEISYTLDYTGMKGRLISSYEVADIGYDDYAVLPAWMWINLVDLLEINILHSGYWVAESNGGNVAWFVDSTGSLGGNYGLSNPAGDSKETCGVRPVVKILKSNL